MSTLIRGMGIMQLNAAPWTPAQLPGLVLWLDASVSASVHLSGSNVTQWDDQSGHGNNFVQATGARQPTYSASGFNSSKPGVTVVAANAQFVRNTAVPFNSATASIFVVQTNVGSGGNDGLACFVGAGQTDDFGNSASFILSRNGGFYRMTSNTYDDGSQLTQTANTPQAVGTIFDGANGTGYLNFTADTPAAKAGTLGATTADIAFGTRPWNGNVNNFDGTYGEIILTSAAMSSGDRASLHSYLTAKWGVP